MGALIRKHFRSIIIIPVFITGIILAHFGGRENVPVLVTTLGLGTIFILAELLVVSGQSFLNLGEFSKDAVTITESDDSAVGLHTFIETWILFRISCCGYKNNVNGNLRIIAAIWTSLIVSFLFMITLETINWYYDDGTEMVTSFEGRVAISVFFFGAVATLFSRERSSMYEKWKYLANIYNAIISEPCEAKRHVLGYCFVLDAIDLDMWSHRSFCETFFVYTRRALDSVGDKTPNLDLVTKGVNRSTLRLKVNKALSIALSRLDTVEARQKASETRRYRISRKRLTKKTF